MGINEKYFYYLLKNTVSLYLPDLGYRRHFPLFPSLIAPLAPLVEQQRIVDRIESLFAKLDEAKGIAEEIIDSFELRKSAILHKAFTGELTVQWRKERGISIENWERMKFKDVLDVRDGTHDSPEYYDKGYPLVTSKNLKDGVVTDKDIKFITQLSQQISSNKA